MNERPWPTRFSLDPRKVAHYLLNDAHIEGGAKARFFKRFGYDETAPFALASALLAQPSWETFAGKTVSARGDVKLVFEGEISSPDGRHPRVRTVWRLEEDGEARFVTAVPLTR